MSNAGERLLRRAHFDIYHKPVESVKTSRIIFIMSETMFAKALMSGLEKRPSRLSSDHVSDPRKYPAQAPVCTHLHDTFIAHTDLSHLVHSPQASSPFPPPSKTRSRRPVTIRQCHPQAAQGLRPARPPKSISQHHRPRPQVTIRREVQPR